MEATIAAAEALAELPRATNRALVEQPAPLQALADLRTVAMGAMTPEALQRGLDAYAENRKVFRNWLLSHLVQGVHYGFPPGCEPPRNVDPAQWQAKPSLYKGGAELVADLMHVRAEYIDDELVIKQLGEKAQNSIVFKCLLRDRHGNLVGEGRGAYTLGERKGMGINATIKMAEKRSLVDAVLNAYRLSDLFTQDMEDGHPVPLRNPAQQENAPKAPPRGETNESKKPPFNKLVLSWRQAHGYDDAYPDASALARMKPSDREVIKQRQAEAKQRFLSWSAEIVGRGPNWNPGSLDNWTTADIAAAQAALDEGFAR